MQNRLKCVVGIIGLVVTSMVNAQSLQHPIIYTTDKERPRLLEAIETYDWAQSIVAQLHENVDPNLEVYGANPAVILKLPELSDGKTEKHEFDATPCVAKHHKILKLASEAGMLYYLTENEQYAQLSADILVRYIDELAPRTVKTTTICGNAFLDPRTSYSHFALAYDFIYDFL